MSERPEVSVIVVNYKTAKMTVDCVDSVLARTKEVNYEVIVVDNGSNDGSISALRKWQLATGKGQKVLIESKKNLGFAGGYNLGIKRAKGDYVLLLNSDTLLKEDAVSYVVKFMEENPKVGIASCSLVGRDGSLQATGGYFPTLGRVAAWASFIDDLPFVGEVVGSYHPHVPAFFSGGNFYTKRRQMDWVTGAFFMIRKEVIEKLGGLDEDYFMYVEEVDYCFRAKRAGWEVWYVPETKVTHLGGGSLGGSENQVMGEFRGLALFYKKHFPGWREGGLAILLKLAAVLRIVVLGVILGREEARRVYAKAVATI